MKKVESQAGKLKRRVRDGTRSVNKRVIAITTTIGEYTTSGATVNAALISGLNVAHGVAVSGSNLFVANNGSGNPGTGTIGEYTTSGATVNAALITGLSGPDGIAIDGSDLFVTNALSGTIGEYTRSGATVNAALITGLSVPTGIAIPATVTTTPESGTLTLLVLLSPGSDLAGGNAPSDHSEIIQLKSKNTWP